MNTYFFKNWLRMLVRGGVWGVLAIFMGWAGCATQSGPAFNNAPPAEDAAARDLTVPAGKSAIYVIQSHRARLQTTIQVDQRDVCRLAERTFYRAVLEPGQHQLGVHYEGHWVNGGVEDPRATKLGKQIIISVEPDHVYYFSAGVDELVGMGSQVTVYLRKCADWMGRAMIRDRRNRLTGELMGPQSFSEAPK